MLSRLGAFGTAGARARWLGHLALLVAVVPPVLVTLEILAAGARVPMEDHWDMVPLLERDAAGTLTAGDVWAQQNEHRYVIPWILMLALARLTRWDLATELMLNVVFSLAALGLLAALIHRTCQGRAPALVPWLVLGASLMTFSLVKWENWFWGLSQAAFASALAACATVWALAWRGPTVAGAALAMLGAMAGTLSFANGLVLLAVVPVGLALDPRAAWRPRVRLAVATGLVGAGLTVIYLAGFRHPAKHPSPWLFLGDPFGFAAYVLAYLGAPLGWPTPAWSLAWGAIAVAALVAASAWLLRHVPATWVDVLPWLLLACYVVATAAMVAVGRLGMGVAQAVSSRYTTMSSLLWVSVAVVVALAIAGLLDDAAGSRRARLVALAIAVLTLIAGTISYASVWKRSDRMATSLEVAHRTALECVRDYRLAPDDCLRMSYHDPAVLRERAERLQRLGLGPFRVPSPAPLSAYTVEAPTAPAGAITTAEARPILVPYVLGTRRAYRSVEIVLTGWAVDPATRRPPAAVLVAANGTVLGEARVGEGARPGQAQPEWSIRFDAFRLPASARALEAYAVLDGRRIVRLAGSPMLDHVRPD